VAIALPAYSQEEVEIPIAEVPFAVRQLAQAAVPVPLTTAVIEVDPDGVLVYELSGQTEAEVRYEVDITVDGEIREVEQTITAEKVPEAVNQALQRWVPDFQPQVIERSKRPFIEGTWYEFEGPDPGNGGDLDIEIREDGQRILIQQDLAG
jgi:hypothetical protein